MPPELHNRPERIRAAVEEAANGDDVVVAYAHCGADLAGYAKLAGAHCYEVYGAEHEPATYFLTDFLVRSFDHVVWRGLGLDRHPELRDDYFRQLREGRLARAGADARAARAGGARGCEAAACRSRCARPATPGSNRPWNDYWRRTHVLINEMPRYEILDEAAMQELERGWRRIVSELGIEFLYEDALDVLPRRGPGRRGPAREVRPGLDPRAGREGAGRVHAAGAEPGALACRSAASTWSSPPSTAARSCARGSSGGTRPTTTSRTS